MKKIIFWCAIIAVLLPILPIEIAGYSIVLPKTGVFQILVEIMFVTWVWMALKDLSVRPNYRHPVILSGGLFLLITYLLLPFAMDPALSFWSTKERMMGVVNLTHFYLWLLILSSVFRTGDDWKALLKTAWWTGCAVAVIGIFEWFSATANSRIVGTFGNAGFLMAYLVPITFLSFFLWQHETNKILRRMYLGSIPIFLFAVFLTASRSGVLALAVGFVVLTVGWLFTSTSQRKGKIFLIVFFGISIMSVLCIYLLRTSYLAWGQENLPYFFSRLIYTDFGGDRFAFWKMAIDGFKQRPLFGWGFEQFGTVFDRAVDFSGKDAAVLEPWFDRVHNQFLEILLATGITGCIAYLAYWVSLFWTVLKMKGKDALIFLSALTGTVIVLFFMFETLEAQIVVLLLAAYALSSTNHPHLFPEVAERVERTASSLRRAQVLCILLSIFLLSLSYTMNIKPLLATAESYQAYQTTKKDRTSGLTQFKQSISHNSFVDPELTLWMTTIITPLAESLSINDEPMKNLISYAADEMDRLAKTRSYDYHILEEAAHMNRLAGRLDQAETYVVLAKAINDRRYEAYLEQGEIELLRGNYPQAQHFFESAFSRSVQHRDTLANLQLRLSYTHAMQGQMELAFSYLDQAIALGYEVRQDTRLSIAFSVGCLEADCLKRSLSFVDEQMLIFPTHKGILTAATALHRRAIEESLQQ